MNVLYEYPKKPNPGGLYVARASCVIPFTLTFFYYPGQLTFEKLTTVVIF